MDKKKIGAVLALVLALTMCWVFPRISWFSRTKEELIISAFSIGKADALLLQAGDTAVLIDTGEEDDGEDLEEELRDRGIDKLDLLIVTHFDKDHVGGASYLMEKFDVQSVLMPDYEGSRPEYRAFLEDLKEHPDVNRLTEALTFSTGKLSMTIYPAEDPAEIQSTKQEYDNDMSLVVSVTYGERKFLFTGDIEKTRIHQMLSQDTDWHHDWIKLPHHGRYDEALDELLAAVDPQWSVVCCSNKNPMERKTSELLTDREIPVWTTRDWIVVTVCDGNTITVDYE